MLNLLDYARIASAVYAVGDDSTSSAMTVKLQELCTDQDGPKFAVKEWQAGTSANGFQGAVLESDNDVVFAIKGSSTGKTFRDDWLVNDMQIAINMIPRQAGAASDMIAKAEEVAGDSAKPVSIVGHSLGGALAQIMGYRFGHSFVTFNAPGMKGNLETIPFLYTKSKPAGPIKGFNMILWTDPIGNYGRHIGKTERFYAYLPFVPLPGQAIAHVMGTVFHTLKHSKKWAAKTLDLLV